MSEFRWAALIALWSMLIGPVLDFTSPAPTKAQSRPSQARLVPSR
jgi:hypothetical protein